MEFKHQKDLGPDAIQKWCEELDRKPKRELTLEEGRTLFMCMIHEMWDKQKYISETERGILNMLDNSYFMQSIRDIKEK